MSRFILIFSAVLTAAVIASNPNAQSFECPLTAYTTELPPNDNTASWSTVWYRSEDGALWADAGLRYADGTKALWHKPNGSTLTVTAHRLDGDAPEFSANIPEGYGGDYQASGLNFPVAGCWSIEAKAGDSVLHMVNFVYPKAFKSPFFSETVNGDTCEKLDQRVADSAIIAQATLQGNYETAEGGFIWQTVKFEQVYKGAVKRGDSLEVLQPDYELMLLQPDTPYLLFLWSQPGYHLQVLCALVEIDGDQLVVEPAWGSITTGQSLSEVEAEIEASLN